MCKWLFQIAYDEEKVEFSYEKEKIRDSYCLELDFESGKNEILRQYRICTNEGGV